MRARASFEDEGAVEVLDDIGHRYTGLRPYFGQVVPAGLAATEHPVTCRLSPVGVATPPPLPPLPPLSALDRPVPMPPCPVPPPPVRLPSALPQTQPVWFTRDGNDILVNTSLQRRKGRNLLADPRADVDLGTHGAEQQLDAVTLRYTRHSHYYGEIYPLGQRDLETRVIARLHPRVVRAGPPTSLLPPAEQWDPLLRGRQQ